MIVEAMRTWAGYAEQGREALLTGDTERLNRLIDANFDLRAKIYQISSGNLEMVRTAREAGATAKFAGSGGAIVGTYGDDAMYAQLQQAMRAIGVDVIRPRIAIPGKGRSSGTSGSTEPL